MLDFIVQLFTLFEVYIFDMEKYSLEQNYIWVVQFSQMLDVCFIFFLHFLDSNLFSFVLAHEDCTLGSRSKPLKLLNCLKWNLPVIYWNKTFDKWSFTCEIAKKYLSQFLVVFPFQSSSTWV